MLDRLKFIKSINDSCKLLFHESHFYLNLTGSSSNSYVYRLNNSNDKAVNYYNNGGEQVSVLKWFNDFWVFIEIRIGQFGIFITISIFQGNENDNIKNQLFRMEWDDRIEHTETHPQPHWHITTDKAIGEKLKDFISEGENPTFDSFELVKSEIIEISKIHFAMNANWQNEDTHIHKINDEIKIAKWFRGLFNHLRHELETLF
ncbi:hypothetical protein EGI22_14740 [Lacihabitans sp. LS3-19]|uniref:hypothetical protein n=1 Tax=Lacihabitans sp. LS3-19 TaxID=2487335 RepID=UPI0020CD05DD|nr:hypothetical protein [Lacihabitans sp. LS3-19]MCP9769173.1 hypothetical protein [Lacihabitans sp. LS3-19]